MRDIGTGWERSERHGYRLGEMLETWYRLEEMLETWIQAGEM